MLDPSQPHRLLVSTAVPGTPSDDRLRLLAVIGTQRLDATALTPDADALGGFALTDWRA